MPTKIPKYSDFGFFEEAEGVDTFSKREENNADKLFLKAMDINTGLHSSWTLSWFYTLSVVPVRNELQMRRTKMQPFNVLHCIFMEEFLPLFIWISITKNT